MFDPLLWCNQSSECPVSLGEPVDHNDPLDIYRKNLERLSGVKEAPIGEAPNAEIIVVESITTKEVYEQYRDRYLKEFDDQWGEKFRI